MKRILAALLAVVCISAIVGSAEAGTGNRWVTEPVMWRTSAANVAGHVDSSVFSHGSLKADTSAAIAATALWAVPDFDVSAMDSTVWSILYIKGRTGASTTQGTDSVYVDVQVSVDGTNWVTATPTRAFITGTTHGGLICLEQSGADSYGIPLKIVRASTGLAVNILGPAGGATAPSWLQLWGWPYLRFIVNSDCNGQFVGEVGHWTAD